MIELAIVLVVVAILTAIAIPNLDFTRYRLDAAAGTVQNMIVATQAQTVSKNYPYLLSLCFKLGQYRMVGDKNANGKVNTGESVTWRTLPENLKFVVPPKTIDGQSPWYATGPGLSYLTGGGCGGNNPTLTLYPNGSSSGDMVVYLGSGQTNRKQDYRAIQIYGSTSKVYLWRMNSAGVWQQASQ